MMTFANIRYIPSDITIKQEKYHFVMTNTSLKMMLTWNNAKKMIEGDENENN
jgi:hypothetical protein